jgi:hypothetical protein
LSERFSADDLQIAHFQSFCQLLFACGIDPLADQYDGSAITDDDFLRGA